MPRKKPHPFLFTAALSLLVLAVVGLSSFNFYHKLQEKEIRSQEKSLRALSEQVAFTVEASIEGYFSTLHSIASFMASEPLVSTDKLRQLNEIAQRKGFYRLGLASADGILTLHGGQQIDISDRPYFEKIRQGKSVLTGVNDSRLTNDKMFVLAVPLHRPDGSLLGALHCSFRLDGFSAQAATHTRSGSHHPHIIDRNGTMILPCGRHESSWTGTSIFEHLVTSPNGLPLAEIQASVAGGKPVLTEVLSGSERMMAFFMPLQHNNWFCLVTIPMSEAQQHIETLLDEDVYILLLNVIGAVGLLTVFIILQLRRAIQTEKDLRQGLLAATLGFVEADLDADRILHCSDTPLFHKVKNLPFSQAVQHVVKSRVHEDFRASVADALSRERIRQLAGDITHSCTVDFMGLSDKDDLIWMECKINIKEDQDTGHLLAYCILRDITDKKESESILRKRAERDALTGLYNRNAGSELIDNYLKTHSCVETSLHAFIILDLDNFKEVNDRLGHLTGDQALKDSAQVFMRHFRREDIICRLGGDEFVVFMKDVTLDMVKKKLDTVLHDLQREYGNESVRVSISGSAGFALAPRDGKFFKELYPRADSALYIAKDAGKAVYREYGADF